MKNIGFILLHIDTVVSDNVLASINKLQKHMPNKKFVIFNSYNNSHSYNMPILHINQSKFFSGDIVVFDIISLLIAVSCYKIQNIYYYAYDIPWMIDQTTTHKFWSNLFDNNKVNIIAQNTEIYNIFNKTWKKPIAIAQEIICDEFIESIR